MKKFKSFFCFLIAFTLLVTSCFCSSSYVQAKPTKTVNRGTTTHRSSNKKTSTSIKSGNSTAPKGTAKYQADYTGTSKKGKTEVKSSKVKKKEIKIPESKQTKDKRGVDEYGNEGTWVSTGEGTKETKKVTKTKTAKINITLNVTGSNGKKGKGKDALALSNNYAGNKDALIKEIQKQSKKAGLGNISAKEAEKQLKKNGYCFNSQGQLVDAKTGKKAYKIDMKVTEKSTKTVTTVTEKLEFIPDQIVGEPPKVEKHYLKQNNKSSNNYTQTKTETEYIPTPNYSHEHEPSAEVDDIKDVLLMVIQNDKNATVSANGDSSNNENTIIAYQNPDINDAKTMYNNADSYSWTDNQQKDDWTEQNVTYQAIYGKVIKYHSECATCGEFLDGYFYILDDEDLETNEINLTYKADIKKSNYKELKPIDLTSEKAYNGNITISKVQEFGAKRSDDKSNEAVDIKIANKNGYKKGEMLSLTDTMLNSDFTLNFGDNTIFGIPNTYEFNNNPSQNGVDGKTYLSFAKLYYGADSLNNGRSIASISKFNNKNEEFINTQNISITDNNQLSSIVGNKKFSLKSNKVSSEGNYKLGGDGNDAWLVYLGFKTKNKKGVSWTASANSNTKSLTGSNTKTNYNNYSLDETFIQPILYGEYQVKTVGGDR